MTRLLGAGAFAWVYEAVDLDLEIPVALKVLRPEYAGDPAAETRFRREATTAARLRHPNIVFIRDVGEAEGTVFVAMDLLPLSLERRLEVLPRLPESEVVRLALDIAAALSIAHADGVVHRDIKPDNVMLGSNGEAIVADFGLAGAFTGERLQDDVAINDAGKVMGTPHYFSPEQARGLDVDGRSDLYSLGVMCFRAATGQLPFEGNDWYAVAQQHVEAEPVSPRLLVPDLSEPFCAIVMRLLAKEPDQRFASATLLADALLMLPTAPVSRAVSLVPVDASVTQAAYPYVHSVIAPAGRSWRRTLIAGTVVIAATAAFVLLGIPSVAGLRSRTFGVDALPSAIPLVLDSGTVPFADPALLTNSPVKPPETVVATPPRPSANVRPSVVPQRAHVTVSAPDSASLLVNDQAVDRGTWKGELPVGRTHHFRARLDSAIPGCKSAQLDTNITIQSTQDLSVELTVAPCSVFLLTIRSTDATYKLIARDFSFVKEDRYLGTPLPIVLRRGVYELQVRADRCVNYSDSLTIARNVVSGSDTVSRDVGLICR